MYSNLENIFQCFEIRLVICTTRQDNLNVTEYYNVLTELWYEMGLFYTISWECPANSIKYTKMLENDRVFDFLHGLNLDLDEVCGRLLNTKPFPTLREVFVEVRREENRRKVMLTQHTNSILDPQNSALTTVKKEDTVKKSRKGQAVV